MARRFYSLSIRNAFFKYVSVSSALFGFCLLSDQSAIAINPLETATPEVPIIHAAEPSPEVILPQARMTTPVDRNWDVKGWEHIFTLLADQGINPDYLQALLSDPRMPERDQIFFALEPKESRYLYRKHNTKSARLNAVRFYEANEKYFKEATERYQVPESVILSILQVETKCGKFTGNERVFPRLVRLAQASAPDIIQRNFEEKVRKDQRLSILRVKERGQWLERTFLPHAVAAISVAKHKGLDPLELRGSAAGAIGMPQFLPGNYFTYGVDGNNDGTVDLFTAPDAILSVGKYLKAHGWRKLKLPVKEQRQVIWNYNRSKPYIDTVLAMSTALNGSIAKHSSNNKKK